MRFLWGVLTLAICLTAGAPAVAVTVNIDVESDGKPVSEAQVSFETIDGQPIETADASTTADQAPSTPDQGTQGTAPSTGTGGEPAAPTGPVAGQDSGSQSSQGKAEGAAALLLTGDDGKARGRLDDSYRGKTVVVVIKRGDQVTRKRVGLFQDDNDVRIVVPPLLASTASTKAKTAGRSPRSDRAPVTRAPARTVETGPPAGSLLDGVSVRGEINFGGTNVSAKGDLETTTATGNVSGSNGITDPFLALRMTLMLHSLAAQGGAFGSLTPILQFYAAQNLGGFSNVIEANLHPTAGRDSLLRFRRGFQAGMAVGFAIALNQAGLCGFGSPDGCSDFTLWAGPLLAAVATRVITDETGGGGNYNSFTRNDTLLGAMIGMQYSYLICSACQLPMYLTLGGQLNFAGSPSGAGGTTSPFSFNYDGRVKSYTEAMLWVGVAFQLDQLFRAVTARRE